MNAIKCVAWGVCGAILLCSTASTRAQERPDFEECSEDEKNAIIAAGWTAEHMMMRAGEELGRIRDGGDTSRFIEWFGAYNSDYRDTVEAVLYAAWQDAMPRVRYTCRRNSFGCQDGQIAWSEGIESGNYTVHFCNPYWRLDNLEQGNTVIHELTHFYRTGDYTKEEIESLGEMGMSLQDIARYYARLDPERAHYNAYNLSFYCTE